jgi:tetratricopeptide (TPR) repeat protein
MQKTVIGVLLAAVLAHAQEKPVVLHPGLGIWRHAIHTKSAEAQKYFDQGLALLFGFNMYESGRSFRKAVELDPEAPMAHWGVAMASGPYINMELDASYKIKDSCAAAQTGLKLKIESPRERAYLEAAATRCPDYQKPEAYVAAMKSLSEHWPDDLDAATLYAESLLLPIRWHWYSNDGKPAAGELEAERVLEGVLRRWPDHPGANHLYVHAVEASPTPERAIASAQRLMGIMPQAGHMVHMPGHIWLVLGEWETAASVNLRAVEVDRQYFGSTGVTAGSYPMYMMHNMDFIAYARWMQGRRADGLKAADDLAAAMAPMAAVMPEMADGFLPITKFGLLRFGEWDALLKAPQPPAAQKLTSVMWHFGRGLAFAGLRNRTGARDEQAAFERERKALPASASFGLNKASDVLSIASEILAARVLGDGEEAVSHLRRAVAAQDGLNYDEPPDWYYPVRESLGAALLRTGRAAEAEAVFREGAKRSPKNGRMLFGLMESLRAQSKGEEFEMVRREFEAAWAKADIKLRIEDL